MTSELVERLRRTYRREYAPTGPTVGSIENRLRPFPILATYVPLNPDGPEAADEIEHLTAQLAEARESERAAMTEVNGLKDALAQVPEFICRKCGRRQDGPTDNEARF